MSGGRKLFGTDGIRGRANEFPITPEVSRSSRWTSSRYGASGSAALSASITPKDMPLPPCTASPAGLSITRRRPSS